MEKLTKLMALEAVKDIEKIKCDDEVAHSQEDSLHFWFISCVAENMYTKKEMIEIAEVVKMTAEIDFARWCV